MKNSTLEFVLKQSKQPMLVVVEQKGSDEEECKERVLMGYHVFRKIFQKGIWNICFMVVGGANKGVSPRTIRKWLPAIDPSSLFIEKQSSNTREKALSIATYSLQQKIHTVFQITSLYHSLRAYLTTLYAFSERGIPPPDFYNLVCDTNSLPNIHFTINDEYVLANHSGDRMKYRHPQIAFLPLETDFGLRKYYQYREDEVEKIVAYSENGKKHLVTNIDINDILKTYIINE